MSEALIWAGLVVSSGASVAGACWLWSRSKLQVPCHRLTVSSLPVLLVCVFWSFAWRILEAPSWSYNGTRLAPSFALTRGYHLYYPAGEGPALSTVYAPITAITYLPATLAHTPNGAVLAGATLTTVICLLPLLLLMLSANNLAGARAAGLFGFATSALFVLYSEPLRYSCINVHADGPALAFGGAACLCLLHRNGRYPRLALLGSATCAVLSMYSKQIALPLVGGLGVFLLIADGRKSLARFLLWYITALVVVSSVLLAAFGPKVLWFNLVLIQGKVILQLTRVTVHLVQTARALISHGILFIVPIGTSLLYSAVKGELRPGRLRLWARSNEWLLLFLAGLALLPGALFARSKLSGDINSLSFVLYYFNAATGLIFAQSLRAGTGSLHGHSISVSQSAIWTVAILVALVEAPTGAGVPSAFRQLPNSEQEVAYSYITRHPGKALFMWFPLSHLLAEGALYHTGWGLAERELSGNRVSDQHFRAGIPPNLEIVAYGNEKVLVEGVDLSSYLPEFHVGPAVAELPGWVIYTNRNPGGTR